MPYCNSNCSLTVCCIKQYDDDDDDDDAVKVIVGFGVLRFYV